MPIIQMSAKCSDMFSATLLTNDGRKVGEYEGYVPDFFPGQHFGDYVQFDIDTDTGKIMNWKRPTKKDLEIFPVDKWDEADRVMHMKVKYRIVIEVESDTESEDTPDRWNMSDLMDAPAELISYEELGEVPCEKRLDKWDEADRVTTDFGGQARAASTKMKSQVKITATWKA